MNFKLKLVFFLQQFFLVFYPKLVLTLTNKLLLNSASSNEVNRVPWFIFQISV